MTNTATATTAWAVIVGSTTVGTTATLAGAAAVAKRHEGAVVVLIRAGR